MEAFLYTPEMVIQKYNTFLVGVPENKNRFPDPLKEEQVTGIAIILSGQDLFVSLPTGFGKSETYIIPGFLRHHEVSFMRNIVEY
jgi:superfamily II DNA/RNA helicase